MNVESVRLNECCALGGILKFNDLFYLLGVWFGYKFKTLCLNAVNFILFLP